MKKIVVLIWAMLPLMVVAAERSAADAAQLAATFLNEQSSFAPSRKAISASSFILTHTRAKLNSDAPAFYVFNHTSHEGFVVVSGDDRTVDVLMYSYEGSLDVDDANPNLTFWLDRLQEEISAVNDENAVDKSPARKAATVTAITPLLKNTEGQEIAWDQGNPYNILCPKEDNQFCYTGCVATAAAQVMYMWRHPVKGTGTKSYTWNKQTISQDFGATTFDWNNMLYTYGGNETSTQKKAVATLMRCCGVACMMNYGKDGSGAFTDDMAYGLITYLGYSIDKFVSSMKREDYQKGKGYTASVPCEWEATTATFTSYINRDLEEGRPVIMGGEDKNGNGGHEFVADGRDVNNKFHINFGWNGKGNSYCELSAIKTGSYDFSKRLDAIVGIHPRDSIHVTNVSISPAELTLKINEKATLKAVITPEDADEKGVSWSLDNPAVASISSLGEVIGLSKGTAVVTVTTVDGKKTATATVNVTDEIMELPTYKWVREASELQLDDDILVVATHDSVHYAMTNIMMSALAGSSLGAEIITISDSLIKLPTTSKIAPFTLAGQKGEWNLVDATNGKLGVSAEKKFEWNKGVVTWSIAVDTAGVATIASTNNKYGQIGFSYNQISSKFISIVSDSDVDRPMVFVRINKPTAIEEMTAESISSTNAVKFWHEGQLYIMRGGHVYTIQGQVVK